MKHNVNRYDVIIVGGGPAGSSCAWKLRTSGQRVLVLDRREFPRNKPCAGWITPPVVDALGLDLSAYHASHTLEPVHGFSCGIIGGDSVDIRYDEVISYGICRCEFDAYLLERSQADLQLGETVNSISFDDSQWLINSKYAAPLLIGAGGHYCPVARRLGARQQEASVVVAREVEFPVAGDQCRHVDPQCPQLYFCDDLVGYGWCLRKGNYLNVGLGRTDPNALPKHVDDFVEFVRERNQLTCDFPDRWPGHAYQLYERVTPKLVDEAVMLIGDSAGLASAVSGEGIRPAVESGLIAAEVIMAADGQYDRQRLDRYAQRLQQRFGAPRQMGLMDRLPTGPLNYVGRKLLTNSWFCRKYLLDKWFLHRNE